MSNPPLFKSKSSIWRFTIYECERDHILTQIYHLITIHIFQIIPVFMANILITNNTLYAKALYPIRYITDDFFKGEILLWKPFRMNHFAFSLHTMQNSD